MYVPLNGIALPRNGLATILNGKQDNFFVMAAPVCSTFVPINAGTHKRTLSDPLGDIEKTSVHTGNLLATRKLARSTESRQVVRVHIMRFVLRV